MAEQAGRLLSRWREWRRRRAARTLARGPRRLFQDEEVSYTGMPHTPEFLEPVRREAELDTGQADEPLLLAARDDVFDFEVLVHFRWHSHDMSAQRLH